MFGPDHFNGFFYELMPAFCVGTAAEGSKDWHLQTGPLRVPQGLATSCVRFLQSRDFDVAISHQMKVDHGITIPLLKLTGALTRYDVLPIFVNCAADPRPSFRRVRRFGEAIGEFLADKDLRVTSSAPVDCLTIRQRQDWRRVRRKSRDGSSCGTRPAKRNWTHEKIVSSAQPVSSCLAAAHACRRASNGTATSCRVS